MPEYLSPGVYVEEVSFRAKSLEGVPTSTTGMTGLTRYGPVWYRRGPSSNAPRLITSFTEFERVYGGLEPTRPDNEERINYLAHAARAFFLNGGQRLYVSRVFVQNNPATDYDGCARRAVTLAGGGTATWRARWPGVMGQVHVACEVLRSKNLGFDPGNGVLQVKRARHGAVVEIIPAAGPIPIGNAAPSLAQTAVVQVDAAGVQTFVRNAAPVVPALTDTVQLLELRVRVTVDDERIDVHDELATHPDQKRCIGKILQLDDPEDENAAVWLDWDPEPPADPEPLFLPARLLAALHGNPSPRLSTSDDGAMPDDVAFAGREADLDDTTMTATGLAALGDIDDIAIVALPDSGDMVDTDTSFATASALVGHAERLRYRIAVVDAPRQSSMNEIRNFRGRFDSKYAAMYHPWIEILDPTERASQGAPQKRLLLPPSGFVTGIYARSDIERGVHKAPANEVVRGLTRFEMNINKGRNDVLNPEGVNCLRFFDGRGNRVWGARTMSSDPEWKYVNVRRLFIYLEHTLDKGTQWAVFEPNNERLWANVRRMVEDFLYVLWRDGALLGEKPEQAYFVRCDRTTMSQNDLDNGRMICLVGVAPVKPAEFVIFRVGQWTADVKS
ncbi:MAG: phage tail sheath subtilisin-like domain-containing protein [Rubrivivax sp.]|nr:phage tail sheath subtilisin-like domain-containing protein [Rubrivivax sp.]